LTKCEKCHKGLNSSYIRVGAKESFKKVGLYCIACDIYYSPDFQKQYTNQTGPVGFDPMTCGSEDRRDILTTLRTLLFFCILPRQLYNLSWLVDVEYAWSRWFILLSLLLVFLLKSVRRLALAIDCWFLLNSARSRLGNKGASKVVPTP
jgi:hypothetical protein